MDGKYQKFLIISLFIVIVSSACSSYQLKHNDIGVKGVRKVDQYDRGEYVKSFYEMQDPQTKLWFEAEKGDDGTWRFTPKGKEDRRDQREFLRRGF
jgi:hypothetical protein